MSTDTASQPPETDFIVEDMNALRAAIDAFKGWGEYTGINQRHYFMAKAIRAYLSALPAAPMPVKAIVRALEWEQENACIWSADDYKITDFQGVAGYPVPGKRFELRRSSGLSSKLPFNTLEAAKAAAQADYVERILSALDVPAHPEGGWQCAAHKQGSAGGNDPSDCGWPECGCDPYADKVIAALQESGFAAHPEGVKDATGEPK